MYFFLQVQESQESDREREKNKIKIQHTWYETHIPYPILVFITFIIYMRVRDNKLAAT